MDCTSEVLKFGNDGKTVSSVLSAICVIITSQVYGFQDANDGSTSVFKDTASKIETIDFSSATNLETIGSYTFYNCANVKEFNLSPCTKLKSIGICAFSQCTAAITIEFPENSNLLSIPGGCFYKCSLLKSFTVPHTVKTLEADNPNNWGVFSQCYRLETVLFSSNSQCNSIRNKVFYQSSLKYITLPASLTSIDGLSFRECYQLETISVEEGNNKYKSLDGILLNTDNTLIYFPACHKSIQNNELELPPEVSYIQPYCFSGVSLTKFTIPSSVTYLSRYMLSYSNIQNVVIPATVKDMGELVFASAYSLLNVTFLNQPTYLPNLMFKSCSSMASFNIPPTVEKIGDQVFKDCSKLQNVYVPKSVTSFGSGVFTNCHPQLKLTFDPDSNLVYIDDIMYSTDMTILKFYIGSDSEVHIPSYVKKIDQAAFQNQPISTIIFDNPDNITEIASYAFSHCKNLNQIELPSSITNISSFMFQEDSNLKSINIPLHVVSIEEGAFCNCTNLEIVTFESSAQSNSKRIILADQQQALTKIGANAFENCKIPKFVLPDSVEEIKDSAFEGCQMTTFKLPTSLISLGQNVFSHSLIASITYDENIELKELSYYCLSNMDHLNSFDIPNSVKIVYSNAFDTCNQLQNVKFGQNLETVEDYAFYHDPLLASITIADNVFLTNLTGLAFSDCPSLVKFELTRQTNFYFKDGMLLNKNQTDIVLYLKARNQTEITIPKTVSSISQYAFSDCITIEKVEFEGGSEIKDIKLGAFSNCINLESINLPNSLESLGTGAFENCNLKIIYLLQSNITHLPKNVFAGNTRVQQIVLPIVLESVTNTTFMNINPTVAVFYHGEHVMEEGAGLNQKALVFAYPHLYKSNILFAHPVLTQIAIKPSCQYLANFNTKYSVVLISLLHIKH